MMTDKTFACVGYLVYVRYLNGTTFIHRGVSHDRAKEIYRGFVDNEFDKIKSVGYIPNEPGYAFLDGFLDD
jgi:hypothetical protein